MGFCFLSPVWGYGFAAVTIISLTSLMGVATIPFLFHVFAPILHIMVCSQLLLNPFAPELPVTAHADPGPFYPL